ncbi:MAG TPA: Rieske 2Fe-2S domain-containing protein [Polyangiaceae bacterium]|jgi:Rieske Fe-S protein|nr:Rieske 2Fe-2S domain-containing protein [Polyangiaceae bacterium]
MSNIDTYGWKVQYPIRSSEEQDVCRRQFVKAGCACAAAVGAGLIGVERLLNSPESAEPVQVALASEIAVGDYRLFRYPTENDPCILVRLADDQFVAYSQSCTHLSCPVHYEPERRQLYCPCHEGYFSVEDGSVLGGPPPRPLPRYPVELRDGAVWVLPVPAA